MQASGDGGGPVRPVDVADVRNCAGAVADNRSCSSRRCRPRTISATPSRPRQPSGATQEAPRGGDLIPLSERYLATSRRGRYGSSDAFRRRGDCRARPGGALVGHARALLQIVGAPAQQTVTAYYWQRRVSGLAQGRPPHTRVARQPSDFNNVNPVYASDDRSSSPRTVRVRASAICIRSRTVRIRRHRHRAVETPRRQRRVRCCSIRRRARSIRSSTLRARLFTRGTIADDQQAEAMRRMRLAATRPPTALSTTPRKRRTRRR